MSRNNWISHIAASHSRQPLIKGERLVRYEGNTVMQGVHCKFLRPVLWGQQSCFQYRGGNWEPGQSRQAASVGTITQGKTGHYWLRSLFKIDIVTPKGVLLPALCHASATREGPWASSRETPPQRKINVTCKSPVGDISVVTLIRTDTTLDHSQKAEKVWFSKLQLLFLAQLASLQAVFGNYFFYRQTCALQSLRMFFFCLQRNHADPVP